MFQLVFIPPVQQYGYCTVQIQIKNNTLILKSLWEIPAKTMPENIARYNKPDACIDKFKKLDLEFFLPKILEIKPLNSIHEINEIKIKEIIKMYK